MFKNRHIQYGRPQFRYWKKYVVILSIAAENLYCFFLEDTKNAPVNRDGGRVECLQALLLN